MRLGGSKGPILAENSEHIARKRWLFLQQEGIYKNHNLKYEGCK